MTNTAEGLLLSTLTVFAVSGCASAGNGVRSLSSGPFAHRAKTKYQLTIDPNAPSNAPFVRKAKTRHPRIHYQVQVTPSAAAGSTANVQISLEQAVGQQYRVYTYQHRMRRGSTKTMFAPNADGFQDGKRNLGNFSVEAGKQRFYITVRISGGPGLHRKWGRSVRLTIRSKLPFEAKAGQSIRILVIVATP